MKFKAGEIVTLKHYSIDNNNKGIISEAFSDGIVIKPEKDFLVYSFFDSDPVVIGYESENIINLCESTVSFIDYKENSFTLTINNIQSIKNKRITQRFPVSLCAYIINNNAQIFSYIRNISLDGLCLCSKQEFKKGDVFSINTRIANIELNFKAKIVWKNVSKVGFEYGLEFHSVNSEVSNTLERCIEILRRDQEIAVNRLKYDFEPLKRIIQRRVIMN
jgi:hypothetical protein